MSLLNMIQAYDSERELYIADLEQEIVDLKKQVNQLITEGARDASQRAGMQLKMILAGCFDNKEALKEQFKDE